MSLDLRPHHARAAALLLALCSVATASSCPFAESKVTPRVLVFSRTTGYRHESIAAGKAAIMKMGREWNYWIVDTTEDAGHFTDETLKRYHAVVFLNTSGDVLDPDQQAAFERYVRGGGGFAGIHSAADTEYEWPWYGRLVGAYFASHPEIQQATFSVASATHTSTHLLPARFEHRDELYNFRQLPTGVEVLLTVDESTYQGGAHGATHPMAWYHEFEGGRAFYTALGHTAESYSDPRVYTHLRGGINSAAVGVYRP
jgi:type 1 glutamine amidotransferase